MTKPSLRDAILNAGLRVMFQSGYQGTGVRDICAAAGAPQGSFTNHFRSKEAFAREVLDRYFADVKTAVSEAFGGQIPLAKTAPQTLPGNHHRQAGSRSLAPRLPDRRFQLGSQRSERPPPR